jgi:hypothetical protein
LRNSVSSIQGRRVGEWLRQHRSHVVGVTEREMTVPGEGSWTLRRPPMMSVVDGARVLPTALLATIGS